MNIRMLAVLFCYCSMISIVSAKDDHHWQQGILQSMHVATEDGGSISIPVGGTPATKIGNITMPGTAPTYFSIPMSGLIECVAIDGMDGLRYTGCWYRHLPNLIINDPIDFAVDDKNLFIRDPQSKKTFKLSRATTMRLIQNPQ